MSSAMYDYIEDIADLSNDLYEYKPLKGKKALGDELIKALNKYNCDPAKALYKITNGSNNHGFRLMKVVSDAPLRLKYKSGLVIRDGIGMIGKGAYGTVYIGCVDKACKKEVAIKMADAKENRLEYNFMKKFIGVSPNITHAYYYKKCAKPIKSVLYIEYYSFGSVKRLLGKYADKLRKLHYRVILFQIIWTLAELHKKFPSFRHNDLHTDNVFIDDRVTTKGSVRYGDFVVPNIGMNAMLGDFGFANMQADGFKNPKVQSGEYKYEYGITTDSDIMYDIHFFLNDLYMSSKDVNVKAFIKRHFPADYLTVSSPMVEKSRLRFGVDHSRLPSFDQLLGDKIFRFFRPRGNTVIPPVNTFPKVARKTLPPVTSPKKSPQPKKVARKTPPQIMSPKKSPQPKKVARKTPPQIMSPKKNPQPKKVVSRPILPSPKKTPPLKFKPENIERYRAVPINRAVPQKAKKVYTESKLNRLMKNSPKVAKPNGAKIQMKINARKAGVILDNNTVKFTNTSVRGKKCDTFKKEDVIAKAVRLGLTGMDKLSKEKICAMIKNALA